MGTALNERLLKLRLTGLHIKDVEIIRHLNASGMKVTQSDFSKFKSGVLVTPKAERCLLLANEYIDHIEQSQRVG